jgi:hypothetical protein
VISRPAARDPVSRHLASSHNEMECERRSEEDEDEQARQRARRIKDSRATTEGAGSRRHVVMMRCLPGCGDERPRFRSDVHREVRVARGRFSAGRVCSTNHGRDKFRPRTSEGDPLSQ